MRITKLLVLSICVVSVKPIGILQPKSEDDYFEIVKNEEESYILFKNEVGRKGVKKEEEFVDISSIRDLDQRLDENEKEMKSLLDFEKTTKAAVALSCPNFQMNGQSHIDDINDVKFRELNDGLPVRIAHGEHTGEDGSLDFLVTMEKKKGKTFCFFEYSVYQRNNIQSSAIDTELPYTYQEMEVFFDLQSASMINIETRESCAARGVVVANADTRTFNMTRNEKITDQIIGRASCARLCMSEDYKFNFLLKNNEKTKNEWPCKWWAYTPEDNMCYLHKGDMPKISKDYRRAGSLYGSETYKDFNSLFGPVKCVDRSDTRNPFILIDSEVVNVQEICKYVHNGISAMQDIIVTQCYPDFTFRHTELVEQRATLKHINEMLTPTTVQRHKRLAALPFLVQLPSLFTWISAIVKGTKDTPKMISANKVQPNIFDRMTLDKSLMFKGLIEGLQKTYGKQYVNGVHTKIFSNEATKMVVPENWIINIESFDIELLRNNSHSISFSHKMTTRVHQNWLWNARRAQDKKELVELEATVKKAREDETPMSKKLASIIDGKAYVFLSLVENFIIKRLYMMAQQVSQFPETQYLLISISKQSNISEGHYISNHNSDLKVLRCLAKSAEKEMPKSCQKEKRTIQDYTEFDLYSKQFSRTVIRVFVEDDIIQIACYHTSDVIIGKGVIIIYMDRSCTIKRNGKFLRIGQQIDPQEAFGFKVIHNAPTKMNEGSLEGKKELNLEKIYEILNSKEKAFGKLKKQLETLEESSYEGIALYVDIGLTVVLFLIVAWMFVYKTIKKYFDRPSPTAQ